MVYSLSCYIVEVTEVIEVYRKPTSFIPKALTAEFVAKIPEDDYLSKGILLEQLERYFIIDNEDLQGFNQFNEAILKWRKHELEEAYNAYVNNTKNDYHRFSAFKDYIY